MECEIREKRCEQTVKVFVKGSDELQLCYACVLRLPTKKLVQSEDRQRYGFKDNRRKNGLLRGRISRVHRLPKG
jgi:hypothetical protein